MMCLLLSCLFYISKEFIEKDYFKSENKNTKKIDIMTKYRTVWLFHVGDRKDAYTVGEL